MVHVASGKMVFYLTLTLALAFVPQSWAEKPPEARSVAGTPRSTTETSTAVLQYRAILKKLDRRNPESVTAAVESYKTLLSTSTIRQRDEGYVAFSDFLSEMLEAQAEKVLAEGSYVSSLDTEHPEVWHDCSITTGLLEVDRKLRTNPQLLSLYRNGMDIYAEVDPYVGIRPGFEYGVFSKYASAAVTEYLILRDKELREGFQTDNSLVISFSAIAARVARWEKYMAQFPDSVLLKEVTYLRNLYRSTLMFGLANTRVPDLDGHVPPDAIGAYREFIRGNPRSETSRILELYIRLLSRRNVTHDSIESLASRLGIEITRGEISNR